MVTRDFGMFGPLRSETLAHEISRARSAPRNYCIVRGLTYMGVKAVKARPEAEGEGPWRGVQIKCSN